MVMSDEKQNELRGKIEQINITHKMFPSIYGFETIDDKTFIEMELFDGDVTQLLFEKLPREILRLPNYELILSDEKILGDTYQKHLFDIFYHNIPKSIKSDPPDNEHIELYQKAFNYVMKIIGKQILILFSYLHMSGCKYTDF